MIAAIEHRGLVTETAVVGTAAVATRRLPIVDRTAAVQPVTLTSPGGGILAYNGEIYNCPELRTELATAGASFVTESDTEVVAVAMANLDEHAVTKFRGEFAFAVADPTGGRVYLARDALGVKPLYYSFARASVFVASEIKALTFLGTAIHALPPGSHGWVHANGHTALTPFTADARVDVFDDVPAAIEAVRNAVVDSIRVRLRTDLPVAVILSGGLDSTIVACVAARERSDVTAFTVGDSDSPDVVYARKVASHLGIDHVVVDVEHRTVSARDVREAVAGSELTEYGDVINAVISNRLFATIRDHGFRIAIGGDGSDEVFGGYPMYASTPDDTVHALFAHKLGQLHRTELQRVDRASMSHTVEVRVPFLDPIVVNAARRIPTVWRHDGDIDKWLLRAAFADWVPAYVLSRPKHGLSYSSGLHDRVRMFRAVHERAYRAARYDLHAPLRRDFDAALRRTHGGLTALLADGGDGEAPTRLEVTLDTVSAIRWNLQRVLGRLRMKK
ncbi:asparagine synthetase B family protein [Rhodococcus sp. UNC23MFCrub1.1]|uniref:asparagine synthetase B family protein n=1 Tax=Rhodococcus sp. UNC23MFCrub1.1 TaxID=1449068 RepID=UPI0018CC1A25|nr:asparagine synthase-related protein [Rhodococcus sp. UNC23MFCrub1.1]